MQGSSEAAAPDVLGVVKEGWRFVVVAGLVAGSTVAPAEARPPDLGTCLGRPVTIRGTGEGDSPVYGTARPDVIDGGEGRDTIYGRKGRDFICGGPGSDDLYGGNGADNVNGGPGVEDCTRFDILSCSINGGRGPDVLWAGTGRWNNVWGGQGSDLLIGGSDADGLNGGGGPDLLRGRGSGDIVSGGAGMDRLFGGRARDSLYGEEGADRLRGRRGKDWAYGGRGHDACFSAENFVESRPCEMNDYRR